MLRCPLFVTLGVILLLSSHCHGQFHKLLMAMVDGETKSFNWIEHHTKEGALEPFKANDTVTALDITEEMNFLYTSVDADKDMDPYDQGQTFLANATYLHLAAMRGFGKVAERLLSLGAIVNDAGTVIEGRLKVQHVTPVHLAAIFGPSNASIIDVLHAHGADLSAETKDRHITPIMFAIELGHKAIFDRLLTLMDIEAYVTGHKPRNVSTPVTIASENLDGVDTPILQQIKREDVIPLKEARREATHSWLHLAAMHGHIEMAQALLDHPILRLNPDDRAFGGRGDTALAAACQSGQLGMIRFLINRYGGEGLISPSQDGITPWHLAKRSGKLSVTRWLREWAAKHGMDLEATRPNPFRLPDEGKSQATHVPLTPEEIEQFKRNMNSPSVATVVSNDASSEAAQARKERHKQQQQHHEPTETVTEIMMEPSQVTPTSEEMEMEVKDEL